jgi:hypothetical protein
VQVYVNCNSLYEGDRDERNKMRGPEDKQKRQLFGWYPLCVCVCVCVCRERDIYIYIYIYIITKNIYNVCVCVCVCMCIHTYIGWYPIYDTLRGICGELQVKALLLKSLFQRRSGVII